MATAQQRRAAPWALHALPHASLNATFRGRKLGPVAAWRGIQYARVGERFAEAEGVDDWGGEVVECAEYGPRCPQNAVDVGYLLRLPEKGVGLDEHEDEFACLNLDVTGPAEVGEHERGRLPVMVWIHGGSQVVTFGSGASGVCDAYTIVKDSCGGDTGSGLQRRPIIVVSVQYRLNMFAFGDGKGSRNLALKDQRLAIEWVRKHIGGFGGDPNNITVAGESAGAVYAHAQVVTGAPVRQAILSSGSLGLSPPQPLERGETLIKAIEEKLGAALKDVPVEALLKAQAELNINSLWLQEEADLEGWDTETGNTQALLIGDVEYESIIWRRGVEAMSAGAIVDAFDRAPELRGLYNISHSGALDFIHDVRFGLPIRQLSEVWRSAGKAVFTYVIDEANPWQTSSRAHHAIDLLFLFGGVDMSFSATAAAVGSRLREKWICFVNGEAPWARDETFAFGPFGECRGLSAGGVAARRRVAHMKALSDMAAAKIHSVFLAVGAGRVSLWN
ncbi:uncharacterized protein K452DRAFT_349159 [Aplosporella prunicola CBS 121167]|uniref:Carboxylic ester hydrolase n=1 Tax=Aplosporella prunicola CBS 121167 TaxID=1176127 RepID=A0A6A6BR33_9PEZI|nr:uncharacterized protein K452DRAFT_349159 [Aplosporella prunicola CBS 121167]KAF2145694.1 hypothetical protein K452DRAFT_349159 [Aplosporella prunicola CBS 121167]